MKNYYKYPNTKISVAKRISLHNDRSWVFHPGQESSFIRTYDTDPIALSHKVNLPRSVISTIPKLQNIIISEYSVILRSLIDKSLDLEWRFDKHSMSSFTLALNEALKVNSFLQEGCSLANFRTVSDNIIKIKTDIKLHTVYLYPNKKLTLPIEISSIENNSWTYLDNISRHDVFELCKSLSLPVPDTECMVNIPSVTINNNRVTLKTKLHTSINISWAFQKNSNSSFNAAIKNALKAKASICQLKTIAGYNVFKVHQQNFKAA